MEDGALICFDSPLADRMMKCSAPMPMKTPLIPCPNLPSENNPFDRLAVDAATINDDPFERVFMSSIAPSSPTRRTPSPVASPGRDTPFGQSMAMDSELDISALMTGRALVSSTPHASTTPRARAKRAQPETPTINRIQPSKESVRLNLLNNAIDQMSIENLRLLVKKKMENLEALNRHLHLPAKTTNLKRSQSASSLCYGMTQQCSFTVSKAESSLGYESGLQYSTLLPDQVIGNSLLQRSVEPSLTSIIREEALRLSEMFKRLAIKLRRGLFATPDPELTDLVKDDLRLVRPPWEDTDEDFLLSSDDEEEDGLPKIKIFRLSTPMKANTSATSSDITSLVDRFKKTRSSIKFEKDQTIHVGREQQALAVEGETNATATIISDEQATIVIPPVTGSSAEVKEEPTNAEMGIADANQIPPVNSEPASIVQKKGPLKAIMPLPKMVKSTVASRYAVQKGPNKIPSRGSSPSLSTSSSCSRTSSPRSSASGIAQRREITKPLQRSRSTANESATANTSQKKMTSPVMARKSAPNSRKGVLQALVNAPPLGSKLKIRNSGSTLKSQSSGKENLSK